MGAKERPENFKGVKGKSGRKSAYEEHNKTGAINLLWEKVYNKVKEGEKLTEFEEKLIAPLLSKTIKTQADITSKGKQIKIEGFNYINPNENSNPDNKADNKTE